MELEPLYRPQGVEERWQQTWEQERLYHADADDPRPTYVIAVPPPNVTGALHMGHALNGSIQDALIRWHRMRGFNTLWQPGFDHAGIATQAVVERELRTQGTSRFELGREAFVERVWEWLREYGGVIMGQFRRLGCSLDYERERFTMDDAYVRAVMRFFVHLYERGWIYRDNRIINWCTDCATSISDLEVEHIEIDDAMTYARYPLADGEGSVTIATVRPATILADVAVAVHPDDERYRDLIGREAIVPVVERRVPVIADERVERGFGTGALKITPGHDPVDFEIGRDHGLPELTVIGFDGRMTGDVPAEYTGLTEDEAADRVVAWLRDHGELEKRESYRHAVGHCERSGTRIQPLISLQWWCDMKPMAAAGDRRRRAGPRHVPSTGAEPRRARLAEGDPPVERLAPALVGPPAADLVLRRRSRHVRGDGAGRVCGVRLDGADTRPRRARHLVLIRALAVRDARLARRHARATHASTPAT